jgi:pyrroloquinoline quinone biosynthesis protein D
MLSAASRPRLAAKARLRWDHRGARHMLLYPEKGLVLNATAADVLALCTGEHTVEAIAGTLAARYGRTADAVAAEVLAFLTAMADRALVQDAAAAPESR